MTDSGPGEIALSQDDRRLVTLWTIHCAERGLPLFDAKASSDTRPHDAIDGARGFALGGRRTAHLRSLALAALAAAREVDDPVAAAAAYAAGCTASAPCMHALATPHQVKHALAPALYQARARELAEGAAPSVGDAEIQWAIEQASPEVREVVRRFPVTSPGHSRLGTLQRRLDTGLRR